MMLNPASEFHGLSWHLVHTKPKGEARALENLERQGFEVFLPIITLKKIKTGQAY
jgi:hypothetical protein